MALPTTRPTDEPDWGSDTVGGADFVAPPDAFQAAGWSFKDRPPYRSVNWAWQTFALWVTHFAHTASKLLTLEDATNLSPAVPTAAALSDGDTFILDESDRGGVGGEVAVAEIAGATVQSDVAVTGDEVIYNPNLPVAYERDGTGLIRTYADPAFPGGGANGLRADPNLVVAWRNGGSPNFVVWTRSTGVILFSATAPGTIHDIALGIGRIYVGFVRTGGVDLRAYDTAGATVWSYDHDGASGAGTEAVSALAVHGRYLYLHGSASGHASTATMRAIQASNGFDAAGEGGLGTSTLPGVWDSSVNSELDTESGGAHRLVTDGRILVGFDGTPIKVRGVLDGVVVATITPPVSGNELALDDEHIYHGAGPSPTFARIVAYGRRDSFAAVWAYDSPDGTATPRLASDGAALFGGFGATGILETTPRIRIAIRPRLWLRVDPAADVGIPYRRTAV